MIWIDGDNCALIGSDRHCPTVQNILDQNRDRHLAIRWLVLDASIGIIGPEKKAACQCADHRRCDEDAQTLRSGK